MSLKTRTIYLLDNRRFRLLLRPTHVMNGAVKERQHEPLSLLFVPAIARSAVAARAIAGTNSRDSGSCCLSLTAPFMTWVGRKSKRNLRLSSRYIVRALAPSSAEETPPSRPPEET